MEKLESLCIAEGNRKPFGSSITTLKTESPYDPSIPLLGICTKELKTGSHSYFHTHVHSSIFHDAQKVGKNLNAHRCMNG